MARVRVTPEDIQEARLRDHSIETWTTEAERREVRAILAGPWSAEKGDRLHELGGSNCAWYCGGAVQGEPPQRDVDRALAGVASTRRQAALRTYGRERGLWPHEAAQRLRR